MEEETTWWYWFVGLSYNPLRCFFPGSIQSRLQTLEQLDQWFDTEERKIHDLIKKKNDFQAEHEKKEIQIRAILANHKLHYPHQPLTTVKIANASLLHEVGWMEKHIQDITKEIEEREKALKRLRQDTLTKRLQHEHESAKELCKKAGIKISNDNGTDLTDTHDNLLGGMDSSERSWNKYEQEVETQLQALQPPKRRPEEELLERKRQERMRLEETERRITEQDSEEEEDEEEEEEKKKPIRIATYTSVPKN